MHYVYFFKNMDTKLTLSLDKKVIEQAKKICEKAKHKLIQIY